MNIHLPAILMFTRGTRFWHTAICKIMGARIPVVFFWRCLQSDASVQAFALPSSPSTTVVVGVPLAAATMMRRKHMMSCKVLPWRQLLGWLRWKCWWWLINDAWIVDKMGFLACSLKTLDGKTHVALREVDSPEAWKTCLKMFQYVPMLAQPSQVIKGNRLKYELYMSFPPSHTHSIQRTTILQGCHKMVALPQNCVVLLPIFVSTKI